jgi:hypothetical protein
VKGPVSLHTEILRSIVSENPIFMVDRFRQTPVRIKEYQLVPTHSPAQDGYLPPPAVTQTACGLSLSSYTVLSFCYKKLERELHPDTGTSKSNRRNIRQGPGLVPVVYKGHASSSAVMTGIAPISPSLEAAASTASL